MANLKNFVNSIIENGGASYNLVTGEFNPDNGYMVSIYGHERKLKYDGITKSVQYQVAEYIKDKAIILSSGATEESYFIGAWVENNELYLDVSVKVEFSREAYFKAKENKQLAYFSNAKKETIFIDQF